MWCGLWREIDRERGRKIHVRLELIYLRRLFFEEPDYGYLCMEMWLSGSELTRKKRYVLVQQLCGKLVLTSYMNPNQNNSCGSALVNEL